MIKQPYYMIDFSASACLFEIRVNDYPVIHMEVEGQVSTMIPINYAILKNGLQSVSATLLPNLGEVQLDPNSELKFNIKLFDVSHDFVFKEQFGEYQSEEIADKKLPIIKYNNSFKAEVPYTLEAWQDGRNLNDVKDCRKKLDSAYNKIIDLIQNGEYNTFSELISKRENNMATSMYLTKTEQEQRIKELIQDFNSGFNIQPLPSDSLMLIVGFNKAAILCRANGESALYLQNPETQEEIMLDISFYIPKDKDDFQII